MAKKVLRPSNAGRKPPGKTSASASAVLISTIKIGRRIRRDLGDIKPLAASLNEIGLMQPVVITPDRRLIAGALRIAAAKHLGWKHIPVTVLNLDNILAGEFAENAYRKNFTLSESVAIAEALEEHEKKAARARQAAAGPASGRGKKATGVVKLTEPVKGRALRLTSSARGLDVF